MIIVNKNVIKELKHPQHSFLYVDDLPYPFQHLSPTSVYMDCFLFATVSFLWFYHMFIHTHNFIFVFTIIKILSYSPWSLSCFFHSKLCFWELSLLFYETIFSWFFSTLLHKFSVVWPYHHVCIHHFIYRHLGCFQYFNNMDNTLWTCLCIFSGENVCLLRSRIGG